MSPFGAGGYWMSDRATLVSALLLSSNLCNITMICISISLAEHLPPHSTPIYAQQRRETISDVCQMLCCHVLRTFIQPPPNRPLTSEGPLLTVFVLKTSTFNFNPQKQDTNMNPQQNTRSSPQWGADSPKTSQWQMLSLKTSTFKSRWIMNFKSDFCSSMVTSSDWLSYSQVCVLPGQTAPVSGL